MDDSLPAALLRACGRRGLARLGELSSWCDPGAGLLEAAAAAGMGHTDGATWADNDRDESAGYYNPDLIRIVPQAPENNIIYA